MCVLTNLNSDERDYILSYLDPDEVVAISNLNLVPHDESMSDIYPGIGFWVNYVFYRGYNYLIMWLKTHIDEDKMWQETYVVRNNTSMYHRLSLEENCYYGQF